MAAVERDAKLVPSLNDLVQTSEEEADIIAIGASGDERLEVDAQSFAIASEAPSVEAFLKEVTE